jgi:hypothetical protein
MGGLFDFGLLENASRDIVDTEQHASGAKRHSAAVGTTIPITWGLYTNVSWSLLQRLNAVPLGLLSSMLHQLFGEPFLPRVIDAPLHQVELTRTIRLMQGWVLEVRAPVLSFTMHQSSQVHLWLCACDLFEGCGLLADSQMCKPSNIRGSAMIVRVGPSWQSKGKICRSLEVLIVGHELSSSERQGRVCLKLVRSKTLKTLTAGLTSLVRFAESFRRLQSIRKPDRVNELPVRKGDLQWSWVRTALWHA